MKFRGMITQIICVNELSKIISTIAKLTRTCVLRLTPDKVHFVLSPGASEYQQDITMWCEFPQANIFSDYKLEGASTEQNEIYLDVAPENLCKALRSAQTAKSVKVKLTRKHGASLTFEIELPSMVNSTKMVIHDVPVSVVPRNLWDSFEEPGMPNYNVSVVLPPLNTIKNIVNRMKSLDNHVVIKASPQGVMSIQVETEMATVTTEFKDLVIPQRVSVNSAASRNSNIDRGTEPSEVRVDVRKLSQFLTSQQICPTKVICNILHGRSIHFLLVQNEITLQYIMPAVSL